MIFAKNNEDERSKIWTVVTSAATVVIIFVIIFFIGQIFLGNPLRGTWKSTDSDIVLTINRSGKAHINWKNITKDMNADVDVNYRLNRELKVITFTADDAAMEEAAKLIGGDATGATLESAMGSFLTSFDYNLNQNELTLSEREYGEQYTFEKQ